MGEIASRSGKCVDLWLGREWLVVGPFLTAAGAIAAAVGELALSREDLRIHRARLLLPIGEPFPDRAQLQGFEHHVEKPGGDVDSTTGRTAPTLRCPEFAPNAS